MIDEPKFYDIVFPYAYLLLLNDKKQAVDFVEAIVYDADTEYFDTFKEPIHQCVILVESWCYRCCKGEWAVLNFPIENWGKDIIFTFKEKSDAAMFKLTWVKWNVKLA